jgi:hypothetical protein
VPAAVLPQDGARFVELGRRVVPGEARDPQPLHGLDGGVQERGVVHALALDAAVPERVDDVEVLVVPTDEVRLVGEVVVHQVPGLDRDLFVGRAVRGEQGAAAVGGRGVGVAEDEHPPNPR